MSSATSPVLLLAHSADRRAAGERRGLRFYYRNARMWGKPNLWSVGYAREATVKFSQA
jgi:hypothetical protein